MIDRSYLLKDDEALSINLREKSTKEMKITKRTKTKIKLFFI
jgi:hypothetical protein